MKLSTILIVVSCLQVSAKGFGQKITINAAQTPVQNVFKEIEKQSGYSFIYAKEQIVKIKPVDLKVENADIITALNLLFEKIGFSYTISEKNIILKEKIISAIEVKATNSPPPPFPFSGKVLNEDGTPLVGVSVLIKSTNKGVSTDKDGKFSLEIPAGGATLVFSYVGFESIEIRVTKTDNQTVKLKLADTKVDEVIVVGYGELKRRDLTGSVSSVKISDKESSRGTGIDKLLQGKTAGVLVNSTSGAPGAAVNVRIRGTNSLGTDKEPLYVIDGVIMDAQQDVKNPISNVQQEAQNGLTGINPGDIANIEILKDASATAIYGSRGANGVVLITTKKGNSETPKIVLTNTVSFSKYSKQIPMMDGLTYAKFRNDLATLRNAPIPFPDLSILKPLNWQDEVARTGVSSTTRIAISGITKSKNPTNYYIASGLNTNQGILNNTGLTVGDFRLNLIQQLGSRLKLTTNNTASFRKNSFTQGTESGGSINSSFIRSMISSIPLSGFLSNDTLAVADEDVISSPVAWQKGYDDNSKEFRVISNLDIEYKLSSHWTIKSSVMGDYRSKNRMRFYTNDVFNGFQKNGLAGWADLKSTFYTLQGLGLFNYDLGKEHRINGTIGTTYDERLTENYTISAENYPNQILRGNGIAGALKTNPFVISNEKAQILSFLSRINYSYQNKYLLTLTGRYDGSSRFSEGNKYGFFPSVALAWNISKENFMKNVTAVSNLKLRAGWGSVGKQSVQPYQTINTYQIGYGPNGTGGFNVTYTPNNIPNTKLKWETSEQYNAGIDLSMFKGKLEITLDAYSKLTKDLLQKLAIPASAGFTTIDINRGSIENRGIEFNVNYNVVQKKDFAIAVGVNGAWNKNKIKSLGLPLQYFSSELPSISAYIGDNISSNLIQSPANIFAEGYAVGMFYGLRANGIAQSNKLTSGGNPVTINGSPIVAGMLNYDDVNDDGVIDVKDRVIIGNPNPKFVYGFNTNFTYKKFQLTLLFNGVMGNDVANANLYMENFSNGGDTKNRRTAAYLDAWTPTNPSNKYQAINANAPSAFGSWVIENGSYLRLNNATLSYDILTNKNSFVKGINFYITGTNLFIITKYSGFDPEVNSFATNPGVVGVDWQSYPNSRSVLFGIKTTF